MAEVINTNVFNSEKKFVDFAGLDYFWEKAKAHIDDADAALDERLDAVEGDLPGIKSTVGDDNGGLVKDVKDLQDSISALAGNGEGSISDQIGDAIDALDLETTYEKAGEAAKAEAAAKEYADSKVSANTTAINGLTDRVVSLEGIDKAANVVYKDSYIYLVDADGEKIGDGFDASDFVVDGMLDTVDFEVVDGVKTNNLVFTFNTSSGKEEVKVDFTKYIDTYHADNSSIALDSATNTFSIKEVAANKTKLGQKITIAGGPLANNIAESGDSWPAAWKNGNEKFIPENATMYDIVMNLFCVEKWPTGVTTSDASLVSTVATPSLTYNGKSANNNTTTVEVGTTVEYTAESGASSYTANPHVASGFTYGYSASNDNTKVSSNTSVSATFNNAEGKTTVAAVSDSVPTLTLTGKVSETVNGTAGSSSKGAATKSGSVVIAEGDNKIKAQSKSITYSGTCTALPVYYGCSNLGNTEETLADQSKKTYPSTAKAEIIKTSTAVNSGTIEINCVGAYKVFVGYAAEVPTTSDGVRALNNNSRLGKGTCGTTDTVYTINNNYMVVAVPTGWDFTIQNDLGQADQRNSFSKSDSTVSVKLPNHTEEAPSTVSYDIWSIGWNGGAYKNLVIK